MSDELVEAIAKFEELADELKLNMEFRPGDVQLVCDAMYMSFVALCHGIAVQQTTQTTSLSRVALSEIRL